MDYVTTRCEWHTEFSWRAFVADRLRYLHAVVRVKDPDTFAKHSFGRIVWSAGP
jgi:hypothetical protein